MNLDQNLRSSKLKTRKFIKDEPRYKSNETACINKFYNYQTQFRNNLSLNIRMIGLITWFSLLQVLSRGPISEE